MSICPPLSPVTFGRPPQPRPTWPTDLEGRFDPVQLAVVAYEGPAALVLGAPGTGKTKVAIDVVAHRISSGISAGACLVLAASRHAADALRDRLLRRAAATTSAPLSRTLPGLAYAVLREAALREQVAMPRLISGAEQDLVLRELLAGHQEGRGSLPRWPRDVAAASKTSQGRWQLRELLMRAVEHDLTPQDLARWGARAGRQEWVAAASVYREYLQVLALSQPGAVDPAGLCGRAVRALQADPELGDRWRRRWRCLVVDDAQELTVPEASLVSALCGPGTQLLVLADPDVATQGFRGAQPGLPGELVRRVDPEAPTLALGTAWRQPGLLRAVTATVASRIGAVTGVGHRHPEPVDVLEPTVSALTFDSRSAEVDHLAGLLRRDHLLDGVPWSQLAVISRTSAEARRLRGELTRRGVPTRVVADRPHLPDEPAVWPLLDIMAIAITLARAEATAVPGDQVEALLRSVYGEMDPLGWRRLLRSARSSAGVAAAQEPRQDPLTLDERAVLARWLIDGVPSSVARRCPGLQRVARMITAARGAARWDHDRRQWADAVGAAGVLWAAWSASGRDVVWRQQARAHDARAAGAERDLDAVLALFDAANRHDETEPQPDPHVFVQRLRSLDFTADLLEPRGRRECVEVATVHTAAGRQWRRVVIVGVQDGVWPDLRIRGSLLGGSDLADMLVGRVPRVRDAREALRADETRLFHVAVSRAAERLLVTARHDEEDEPSALFHLVASVPGVQTDAAATSSGVHEPGVVAMSLSAVTARLRRMVIEDPRAAVRDAAARRLAALAAAQVPGADPTSWWAPAEVSDDRPRRPEGTPVSVSPSGLEDLHRCPLRWLIRSSGGSRPRPEGAARIGELVHEILATTPETDEATLHEQLDQSWPSLALTPGWLERRAYEQARAMLTRAAAYLRQADAQGRRLVAREMSVTRQVGHVTLTARLDRVEREPDGPLRIVDFKTGATKPTAAQVARSAQLGAYQLALGEQGEVHAASFVQLGKAANQQVTEQYQPSLAQDPDPEWVERIIQDSAATMAAGQFEARKGPWCRSCDAQRVCPAWVQR